MSVHRLAASWSRHVGSGSAHHIDGYLEDMLCLVRDGEQVSMTHLGGSELALRVGADTLTLTDAQARRTLRYLCARLCILLTAAGEAPSLYGAELSAVATLGSVQCRARLSFQNDNAAPIRFELAPLP